MARITVEDCLEQIPNRFDMIVAAARRAHQLEMGTTPLVNPRHDKPTVVALREIAEGKLFGVDGQHQPEDGTNDTVDTVDTIF